MTETGNNARRESGSSVLEVPESSTATKIIIGKHGETADKVKFSETNVDFDKLRSTTGAKFAYSLSLGAFVAGIVAFAF